MVIGETMITVRKVGMAAMVILALTLAACTTSAVGLAYSTDAHPHVRWIDMTSAAGRAWLLGTYPCSNRTCYVILRSDDGGSTWVRVGAPPVRSTSGTMIEVYLDSLTFANRDDGYAYGDDPSFGQTYWSHDGGETWHRLRHPGIFASPIITTQGHAYGLIYKGNPDIPISTPSSDSVTFVLASSLVTSGTWTMRPLPILGEDNGVSVAAYGSKVWLIVIKNGGGYARLLVSSDGGRNFSSFPSHGMGGYDCTAAPTSDETLWGFCATGSEGYAVRSTDGGRDFVSLPPGSSNGGSILPVSDDEAIF